MVNLSLTINQLSKCMKKLVLFVLRHSRKLLYHVKRRSPDTICFVNKDRAPPLDYGIQVPLDLRSVPKCNLRLVNSRSNSNTRLKWWRNLFAEKTRRPFFLFYSVQKPRRENIISIKTATPRVICFYLYANYKRVKRYIIVYVIAVLRLTE